MTAPPASSSHVPLPDASYGVMAQESDNCTTPRVVAVGSAVRVGVRRGVRVGVAVTVGVNVGVCVGVTVGVDGFNYLDLILECAFNLLIFLDKNLGLKTPKGNGNVGILYTPPTTGSNRAAKPLNRRATGKVAPNLQVVCTRHDGSWHGAR